MKGACEIIHQRLSARVAVRLEQHVDALKAARPRGRQSGADFGGMMSVVIDHGNAALGPAYLKAAVDTAEFGQRLANHLHWNVEFEGHRYSGSGVQSVVRAGNLQAEAAQITIAQMQMEFAG